MEQLPVEEQAAKQMPRKEITVTLEDDSTVTVKKLKAKLYYEAQKYYVEWLQALQKVVTTSEESKGKGKAKQLDMVKLSEIALQANDASVAALKVVAASLGKFPEEIGENYFPDDIQKIFNATVEVNNFIGNLTKSVTLTAGIGN